MLRTLRRIGGLTVALALAACPTSVGVPKADAGADLDGVKVGSVVLLSGVNSKSPDGRDLTYSWSFTQLPQGSRAVLNDPHSQTPSFVADVPGVFIAQLIVANSLLSSAAVTVKITVTDCGSNRPTTGALASSPASPGVGTVVTLTAPAAADKDNDPACGLNQALSYSWKLIAQPASSSATLNNPGAIAPGFTADKPGSYSVRLIITDSTGRASDPAELVISIADCGNNTPRITKVDASKDSPGLGEKVQLTSAVDDLDNAAGCGLNQTFTYQWTTLNLPTGSGASLNSDVSSNPSFTPDVVGTYAFRLVVTDSTGRFSLPFDKTVIATTCGGAVPTATVSSLPAAPQVGTAIQLTGTAASIDNGGTCNLNKTFTYSWSLRALPAGSLSALNNPGSQNPTFTADTPGAYVVELIVTDSAGLKSPPIDTTLNVTACGTAVPVINSLTPPPAAPNIGAPNPGDTVSVTSSVTDADDACKPAGAPNQRQTYAWSFTQKPARSNTFIADPTATTATFVADAAGTYQLRLAVTDETGRTSAAKFASVVTTACGLAAPVVTAAHETPQGAGGLPTGVDVSPNPGQLVKLSSAWSDADNVGTCNLGQKVSVAWTLVQRPPTSSAAIGAPVTASSTSTPANVDFTPDAIGTYQLSAVATDSTGLSSAPFFLTFTTTRCGASVPAVTATTDRNAVGTPPTTANVNPLTTVHLGATATDADNSNASCNAGQTFSYQWSIPSRPARSSAVLSDPTSPAPDFVPDVAGNYQLRVTTTDSTGLTSAPAFVTVTTSPCGETPPGIGGLVDTALGSGKKIGSGQQLSSTGNTNTNCVDSSTSFLYRWKLEDKPLGSQAQLDNPAAATPAFTPDRIGTYQVSLVITSTLGLSSVPAYLAVPITDCAGVTPPSVDLSGDPVVNDPTLGLISGANPIIHVGATVSPKAVITDSNVGLCGAAVPVANYSYRWTLVSKPAGSRAALTSSSDPAPSFVPDVQGAYQVSLSIVDGLGYVSAQAPFKTFTTSDCGASVPVVSITSASTVNANAPLGISASVTSNDDRDVCPARFNAAGSLFTYAWSLASQPTNGSAVLSGSSGPNISFLSSVPSATPYVVAVSVTSGAGVTAPPTTKSITVNACGSHAPVVTGFATTVGGVPTSRPNVGSSVLVTVAATDADIVCTPADSIVSYSWTAVNIPSGSAVTVPAPTSCSGNPSCDQATFALDVAGTYAFSVIATDSTGLRSPPVTVTLATAACAPTFTGPTSSQPSPVVAKSFSLSITSLADVCVVSPSYTLAWAVTQRPQGSLSQLSVLGGTPATASSTAFNPDLAGRYAFSVTATDNAGTSTTQSLVVDVASCGTVLPTLTACAASAAVCNPLGDTPGSPVRETVTGSPKVSPDTGDLVTLSLPNIVDANAGAGSCGSLAVVTPFSYRWTLLSGPAGSTAQLSSTTNATPSLVPDKVGAYQLSVVVTDALGNASAPSFHTLTTSTCGRNPPVAQTITSSVAGNLNPGYPTTLTASATDADDACPNFTSAGTSGVAYAWSLVSAPAGGHATLGASGVTSKFSADLPGAYVVQATATDSTGLSSSKAITVTVAYCGAALPVLVNCTTSIPLCNAAGDTFNSPVREVVGGAAKGTPDTGDQVTLSLPNVTDANATAAACTTPGVAVAPYSYKWTLISGPAGSTAKVSAANTPTPLLVPDLVGDYRLSVTVTDLLGNVSATAFHTLTTSNCGRNRPTVSVAAAPAGAVNSNDAVALTGTFTDPDDAAGCAAFANPAGTVKLAWSLVSAPAGGHASLTSSNGTSTSFTADGAGTYQVQFTGTDSTGLSASTTASIVVNACGSSAPVITSVTTPASRPAVKSTVTLIANTTDADASGACGLAVDTQYLWTLVSAPAGSSTTSTPSYIAADAATVPTKSTFSFLADAAGTYVFNVTARDAAGHTSAVSTISVPTGTCGPTVPAITTTPAAGPGAFSVGTTMTFNAPTITMAGAAACTPGTSVGSLITAWSVLSKPFGSSAQVAATGDLTPDLGGDYTVQYLVTDPGGFSTAVTSTINVGACAAPTLVVAIGAPVVIAPALGDAPYVGANPLVGDLVKVTATATASSCNVPASKNFTYSWAILSKPQGSAAQLSASNAASASFTPDFADASGRDYQLAVTVTDGLGNSGTQTKTLSVSTCGSQAPTTTIGSVPATTVNTYGTAALTATPAVTTTDSDLNACPTARLLVTAGTPAWALVSGPVGGTANFSSQSGATVQFSPQRSSWVQPIPTVVTGSGGLSVPPLTGALTPPAGSTQYVVSASTYGSNGRPGVTNTYPLTASPCGAFAPTPVDGPGASPTVTAFSATQNGAAFPHTNLDNAATHVLSARQAITVTANVVDYDTVATVCPTASPVQSYSYAWTLLHAPAGSTATLSGANTLNPSFTPDVAVAGGNVYTLQLLASDSTGASSTRVFDIPVGTAGCGVSPPAVTINPIGSTTLGSTISLSAVTTNACAASLAYAWRITSLQAGSFATLLGANTASPSFVADVAGNYSFSVTVTDASGLTASDGPAAYTASAPPAFTATMAPQQLGPGGPIPGPGGYYQGIPLQVAGDGTIGANSCSGTLPCAFAWTMISVPPSSAAAFNNPTAQSPSFTPDQSGTYSFKVTVTSGGRTAIAPPQTVTVGNCGAQAPAAAIGILLPDATPAPVSAFATATGLTVQFNASSTDRDNLPACGLSQSVTFSWALTAKPAGSTASIVAPTLSNPTIKPDVKGAYTVVLTATDSTGRSGTATVVVTATGDTLSLANGSADGSQYIALAADPRSGFGPVMAMWTDRAGSGKVVVRRCTAFCFGDGTPVWSAESVVDTGLGGLTSLQGNEARPIDIKVASDGRILVVYKSPSASANSANCGVSLATGMGTTWSYANVYDPVSATCSADGSTGVDGGRWVSLALTADDFPVVGFTIFVGTATVAAAAVCNNDTGCGTGVDAGAYPVLAGKPLAGFVLDSAPGQQRGRFISVAATGNQSPAGAASVHAAYQGVLGASPSLALRSATAANVRAGTWTTEADVVTGTGDGYYARNTIGPGGSFRFSWYEKSAGKLWYGTCPSGGCGGAPSTGVVVASATTDVGRDARLSSFTGNGGGVSIAYLDLATGFVKVATSNGLVGAPFTTKSLAPAGYSLDFFVDPATALPRLVYTLPASGGADVFYLAQ